MDSEAFRSLLCQVRSGNPSAAATLVQQFEPAIRRHVRMQLTDPSLRRVLDSMDICQSVLGNFFIRAALGQFDLDNPKQLFGLLTAMASNKINHHHRHCQTETHGGRLQHQAGFDLREVVDRTGDPAAVVAGRELLEQVCRHLTSDERALVDQRIAGRSWAEIAAERGVTAEALRKQYTRALDRVSVRLGLGGVGDE